MEVDARNSGGKQEWSISSSPPCTSHSTYVLLVTPCQPQTSVNIRAEGDVDIWAAAMREDDNTTVPESLVCLAVLVWMRGLHAWEQSAKWPSSLQAHRHFRRQAGFDKGGHAHVIVSNLGTHGHMASVSDVVGEFSIVQLAFELDPPTEPRPQLSEQLLEGRHTEHPKLCKGGQFDMYEDQRTSQRTYDSSTATLAVATLSQAQGAYLPRPVTRNSNTQMESDSFIKSSSLHSPQPA
eukprot:4162346-Amphidinium_carterae.2